MEANKIRDRVLEVTSSGRYPNVPGPILDIGSGASPLLPGAVTVDRQDATVETGNLYQLPFADNSFAMVFSSHTLEDLEDTERALREWARLVKPGGAFVLYLPDKRWYPNIGHPLANLAHKHDWARQEFFELFQRTLPHFSIVLSEDRPPPGGIYDYENRGNIEYSFLHIAKKRTLAPEVTSGSCGRIDCSAPAVHKVWGTGMVYYSCESHVAEIQEKVDNE